MPYVNPQCIRTLMTHLNLENILLLFKRVLMDTSNLFLSSDACKLIDCCEAIKSLIYPFKYEQVYVPHLPDMLLDRVDAPFIFMLGLKTSLWNEVKDNVKDGTYLI